MVEFQFLCQLHCSTVRVYDCIMSDVAQVKKLEFYSYGYWKPYPPSRFPIMYSLVAVCLGNSHTRASLELHMDAITLG